MTSGRSFHVKEKLDALELVENEDYSELPDIRQLRPQGGYSTKKFTGAPCLSYESSETT
jgi:hypothetical protein